MAEYFSLEHFLFDNQDKLGGWTRGSSSCFLFSIT